MVKWFGQRVDAPGHVTTALPVMSPKLTPIDFKAIAAKGSYVYCYLREDLTPYYIGLSKTAGRPFHRYRKDIKPPKGAPERVRVLRSGLTRKEACEWEIFYIAYYGCKYNTPNTRNYLDRYTYNVLWQATGRYE